MRKRAASGLRGEGLEKVNESSELEKVRGERLEEVRGKGLGGVEAKVNESSAQSGGSMSAKHRGAGV